ncbi:MAG TPA: hypothetical protein VGP46_07850, partial [Acidimicrobiales bacterium]|nr:hypothetical protein [Acidimicrobiales bacterium]
MNPTGPGDGGQALDEPRLSSETATAPAPESPQRSHAAPVVVGFVLVAMLAEILRVMFAYKRITFDVGNYQFYTGYAEIHGYGSGLSLPGGIESFLDPQINTLYYLLIYYLPPRVAVSAIAAVQSLSIALLGILVWGVARRISSSFYIPILAGLVAAAGAYLAPLSVIETGATSSDALLALFVFAPAALLYQVLE